MRFWNYTTEDGSRKGATDEELHDFTSARPFTQSSHGFAVTNAVVHNGTSWVKADSGTSSHRYLLGGVVTSVEGVNDFHVVFKDAIVGGFSSLTPFATYYTGTAGAVSTAQSNRKVGIALSATEIYVSMGVVESASGLLNYKSLVLTPSAAQGLTTSWQDVDLISYDYAPERSDSVITIDVGLQVSAIDPDAGVSFRFTIDGTAETLSKTELAHSDSAGIPAQTFAKISYSLPSWGLTEKAIKLQAREYNSVVEVKLHETRSFEGVLTNELRRPTLEIKESLS